MSIVNLDLITDSNVRDEVADYVPTLRPDGTIGSPGKFEGEPLWTVYYWAWSLQGEGESVYEDCGHGDGMLDCSCEVDIAFDRFPITDEDVAIFPDLAADRSAGMEIHLATASTGFTYTYLAKVETGV